MTRRAVALALAIIPLNCYWIVQMERVRRGPYVTSISLFANAVFILVLLVLANAWVARRFGASSARSRARKSEIRNPKSEISVAFSPAELLVTYSMVALATGLCGMDFTQVLMQMIGHPAYFASPENGWADLFLEHLPGWLVVKDQDALRGFYVGAGSFYRLAYLRAWAVPALAWTGFAVVLLWVMLCVNALFRQQWMARERLTFPIVVLPLELVAPKLALFRSRLMWLGFAPAFGIGLLNGLAFLYPSLPAINVGQSDLLQRVLVAKPWYAVGWTPVTFYPFCIGLGYLLPVDLLFSCWFFYFFWKAQRVLSNAMAWDAIPDFPFVRHQCFGALIGLALALLWTSRGYLLQVWRAAAGQPSELSAVREAVPSRWALAGLAGGMAALVAFIRAAGMSWSIAIAFMVLYLLLSFVITRIRAELGPPVHDFHGVSPDVMIPSVLGTEGMRAQDLSVMSLLWWFNRAYRSHPMPVQMEGLRMAHATGSDARRWAGALMLAGAWGMLCAFWAFLHLGYSLGAAGKLPYTLYYGNEIFGRLHTQLAAPAPPNAQGTWAMLLGLVSCAGLSAMRVRFLHWPFHPIGYAISGSFSMNLVWMPMLIAWVLKAAVLRWGGLRLYRAALPLFLGLILGDITMGCLWSVLGLLTGLETYSFWGA